MGRLMALLLAALATYVAVAALLDNARLASQPDQVAIAQAQAQQAQAQAQAAARIAQARAQEADAQARAAAARAEMWRGIVATLSGQVPVLLLGMSHGVLLAILGLLVWRREAS